MNKKIVFFDGDGTLWYPKSTKYTEKPHWVYLKSKNANDHYKHLIIIPTVLSTLRKLKRMGIITVLLSTSPHSQKEANSILNHKAKHFKVDELFDEIYATREHYASKGEFIIKILKDYAIPKSKALMVGDHYYWDYKSARNVGVDALLIESEYMKKFIHSRKIKKTIKKLSDILNRDYFL